jgi:hypothetical protein
MTKHIVRSTEAPTTSLNQGKFITVDYEVFRTYPVEFRSQGMGGRGGMQGFQSPRAISTSQGRIVTTINALLRGAAARKNVHALLEERMRDSITHHNSPIDSESHSESDTLVTYNNNKWMATTLMKARSSSSCGQRARTNW